AASAAQPLDAMRPRDGRQTYRMDAIWHAMGGAVHTCLATAPDLGMRVVGIGFTAAPALVLDCEGAAPLEDGADVLGAMDRRAASPRSGASAPSPPTPSRPVPRMGRCSPRSPNCSASPPAFPSPRACRAPMPACSAPSAAAWADGSTAPPPWSAATPPRCWR